jgi:hypothetical protein
VAVRNCPLMEERFPSEPGPPRAPTIEPRPIAAIAGRSQLGSGFGPSGCAIGDSCNAASTVWDCEETSLTEL